MLPSQSRPAGALCVFALSCLAGVLCCRPLQGKKHDTRGGRQTDRRVMMECVVGGNAATECTLFPLRLADDWDREHWLGRGARGGRGKVSSPGCCRCEVLLGAGNKLGVLGRTCVLVLALVLVLLAAEASGWKG